jgi:type II protein arginine methyltransferase
MQPLTLNLSEEDYLTFEKDPVKYKLYQKAIHDALVDRVGDNKSIITTIMILGAGRGPLVNAAYYASIQAKCKISLIVVEKNPCPRKSLEKTLDALRSKGLNVTLIYEDMRNLQLEDDMKADIFVSELLGSFGDNELSPECLDEAEKVLKDDGISIPYTYSSYVQPITSWPSYQNYRSNPENFEQPWVLNTPNYYIIDDPKLLWSFHHPKKLRDEKYISNYRHETVSFKAKEDSVLHGFAGYFSTNLYKDIEFNIVPSTHTKDLISWWPMFFASKNVKFVGKGETIKIEFERKIIPNEKVWYQWKIDNDEPSNVEGKYNPFYLTSEIEELN